MIRFCIINQTQNSPYRVLGYISPKPFMLLPVGLDKVTIRSSGNDVGLGDFVVASVDNALGFGPAQLRRAYSCPEDSLATATSIADNVSCGVIAQIIAGSTYQNGWKKPMMPSQSLALLLRLIESIHGNGFRVE